MAEATKFRRRGLAEIEAMQWDGTAESQAAIVTWGGGEISGWFDTVYFLEVRNSLGVMRIDVGDYVVLYPSKGGHRVPLKADVFELLYEPTQPNPKEPEPVSEEGLGAVLLTDEAREAAREAAEDACVYEFDDGPDSEYFKLMSDAAIKAAIKSAAASTQPSSIPVSEREQR